MTSLGLRLVRALLPIATLYVGKLIIDEAVRLVGRAGFDRCRGVAQRRARSPARCCLLEFALGDPRRPARHAW
jgi:ATP-binding cassette subfamily B protein